MRVTLSFLCNLICFFCFGQASKMGDNLTSRVYDTTRIEISSKVYFPFCANIYTIPRENCEGNYPSNCCSYSTSVQKNNKISDWGYVSCYDGSSFSWNYNTSLKNLKYSFEDIPKQLESQYKTFTKKLIKCFIYNTEAEAYLLEGENFNGHKDYRLTTYGSYNGFSFSLEYRSLKKISSSEDIQPVFRQILRIK